MTGGRSKAGSLGLGLSGNTQVKASRDVAELTANTCQVRRESHSDEMADGPAASLKRPSAAFAPPL